MEIKNKLREQIKKQFKLIFGLEYIEFDTFKKGKELHTLFVDIDKYQTDVISGAIGYIISGTLSLAVEEKIGDDFFIHKKYNVSKNTTGLSIGKNEIVLKYDSEGKFFVKNSVDFIYSNSSEFNPPYGKISQVNF